MADVKPFQAIRFRSDRVDLGRVLAPDPTLLTDEEAARLLEGDPRNVARLCRPRPEPGDGRDGALRRAAFCFSEWLRAGLLARDERPAFYWLRRTEGDEADLEGFLGLVSLEDVQDEHPEREPPGADALVRIGEALRASLIPSVLAYRDERHRIGRCFEAELEREPDLAFEASGAEHELWIVDDESTTARIRALLSGAPARLVGGRAAWAAARRYAEIARGRSQEGLHPDAASRYGLAFLVDERRLEARGGQIGAVPAGLAVHALSGDVA